MKTGEAYQRHNDAVMRRVTDHFAGMERESVRTVLNRKAAAPLKPAKEQRPLEIGLFSDDAKQQELF